MGESGDPSVRKRSLSSYLSNVSSRREELEKLKKKQEEDKLEDERQEQERQRLQLEQQQLEKELQKKVREDQQEAKLHNGSQPPDRELSCKGLGSDYKLDDADDKNLEQQEDRNTFKEEGVALGVDIEASNISEKSSSEPRPSPDSSANSKVRSPKSKSLTREDLHSILKEPSGTKIPANERHDIKSDRSSNADDNDEIESDAPTELASPPRPRRGRLIRGDKLQSMSPSHSTFDNESDSELSDIDELRSIHISSSIIHGDSSPLKSTHEDHHRRQQASSPRINKGRSGSPRHLKPPVPTPKVARQKKGIYRDAGGRTRLQISCDKGNYEQAKNLIEQEKYDVNDQDNAGNTALHEAALNGHLDIVKLLTNHGADVNIQSFELFKDTPLIDASANGHLDVVKYLLAHGADPTICNAKGLTAYDSIEEDSDLDEHEQEIVSEIKKHLRSATKRWKSEIAVHSISSMKDKDHKNSSQRRQASEELLGDFEFFWTDITSRAGKQKLLKASKEGKLSYVGSYLENGGRVDLKSFFEAVKLGHEDVTSLFLAFGAKVNAVSREGTTALISAVGRGHIGTVKLLLEAGSDPRKKDKNGHTALYYAENSPMGVVDPEEISLIRNSLVKFGASLEKVEEGLAKDKEERRTSKEEEGVGNNDDDDDDDGDEEDDDDDENVISVGRKRRTVSPDRFDTKRQAPSVQLGSSNLDESLANMETPEGSSKKSSVEPEIAKPQEETPEEREQRLKAEEEYIQRRLQNKKKKEQELLKKLALDEEKREKERVEQKIKEAEKTAEEERLRKIELENRKKELEITRRREIRSLYPLGLRLIDFDDKSDQEVFLPLYYVELDAERSKYALDLQLCVILKNSELISNIPESVKRPVAASHKKQLWNILKPTFLYGGSKNRHLLNWGSLTLHSQMRLESQEYVKFSNLPMNWVRLQGIPFENPDTKRHIEQDMVQIALMDPNDDSAALTIPGPMDNQYSHRTAHVSALPSKFQKRHLVSQLLQDYNSQSFW